MNDIPTTIDMDLARRQIEAFERSHRACYACAQPLSIETRDGVLWLECSSLRSRTGLALFLASRLHERHLFELPGAPSTMAA